MKKNILLIILLTLLSFFSLGSEAIAADGVKITIIQADNKNDLSEYQREINREEAFIYFSKFFVNTTPDSYKYINLKYNDIKEDTELYKSLQILVYHNLLKNNDSNIYSHKKMSALLFYTLSEKILGINSFRGENKNKLKKRKTTYGDFVSLNKKFKKELEDKTQDILLDKKITQKKVIFNDVLNILTHQHYQKDQNTEDKLIEKAIIGLTLGTEDIHTTYFPPTESSSFTESLSGEFEGIGAYVDMQTPGIFKIVTPIPDSPAFNAGLKGGDIVTHVDGKEITKENSTREVVSWIKGPKGTEVELTILRGKKTFNTLVIRDKIIINDIETELLNRSTYYIQIKNFGPNVASSFKESLEELKTHKNVNKVIIDVRNNGGGYLDQVTRMLSYMVPEGDKTAVIKYLKGNQNYKSAGYDLIDFSQYKIVVLQNSGTASASEILAGTIKDYYPESISIGEQSYGKGSVQQTKKYPDGSLLKFTVAKWYTGGTETGIDGIGLTPDIILELDIEKYKKNKTDNQLEKAIKIR
ncbi:MAG: S41 family peptidase [Candidatus Gracilibacteria bacterium]|nr:S41 family peptidase [Candidatus Gracilibacteria bacterium]